MQPQSRCYTQHWGRGETVHAVEQCLRDIVSKGTSLHSPADEPLSPGFRGERDCEHGSQREYFGAIKTVLTLCGIEVTCLDAFAKYHKALQLTWIFIVYVNRDSVGRIHD